MKKDIDSVYQGAKKPALISIPPLPRSEFSMTFDVAFGQPNQGFSTYRDIGYSDPSSLFPSTDPFDCPDQQGPMFSSAHRIPALDFLHKGYDLNVGVGLPSANKDRFSPKDLCGARKSSVSSLVLISESDFWSNSAG